MPLNPWAVEDTDLTIATVTKKTQIGPVDGTPDKRMYWSIVSDYGLKTGLCELVDNALDRWTIARQNRPLMVDIMLDAARQLISVSDNAGGVKEDQLRVLLAPGGSMNDPNAELIGIFGVGSKRAGIALGEHVEIRTRYRKERSLQLDITAEWLETQDWTMNYYAIPDITPGTTQIQISHLRKPFAELAIGDIRLHLGETYAWFLGRGCHLTVNGIAVASRTFETWAFPPDFQPRSATFEVEIAQNQKVQVEITGGLIRDRNPEEENYGVYFYCNNRLVVKDLKAREAGYFVTAEAGVPHPDASLCRVVVRFQGAARLMPWNSSKSAINFDHPLFQYVRPTLIQLTSHYSSLSRRFKDDWDGKVFAYESGSIEAVQPENTAVKNPLVLPPLPRINKLQVEKLKSLNKTQIHDPAVDSGSRGNDGCSRGHRPPAFRNQESYRVNSARQQFRDRPKRIHCSQRGPFSAQYVWQSSDSKVIRKTIGRDRRGFAKGDNPQETTDQSATLLQHQKQAHP